MTSKEWLESKSFATAGKVNTKDALIALELAELEAQLRIIKQYENRDTIDFFECKIAALKQKHNIQ